MRLRSGPLTPEQSVRFAGGYRPLASVGFGTTFERCQTLLDLSQPPTEVVHVALKLARHPGAVPGDEPVRASATGHPVAQRIIGSAQ